MTFYIKPPEGNISLNRLYEEAEIRLQYLAQISKHWGNVAKTASILTENPNIASKSECLIEGSRKDKISHYILRLASVDHNHFQHFFVEAETYLFEYRLNCGGVQSIVSCLRTLKRHTQHSLKYQKLTSLHEVWLSQVHIITKNIIASAMISCKDKETCNHILKVPWTTVPDMVKNRSVEIHEGEAEIKCEELLHLLSSLFKGTLEHGIKQLTLHGKDLFEDERMKSVKRSLYRTFTKIQSSSNRYRKQRLKHSEIQHESHHFPLCMQQLHDNLTQNNRLRHQERFKYTLFLKDIGLPIEENILFWEHFYTKPHCSSAGGCTHTWAGTDKNRYVYSVKHLYGLEGSRKNYASHSCSVLQTSYPQPTEMRGCPFASSNIEEVSSILKKYVTESPQVLESVAKEVTLGRPTAACQLVFAFQMLGHRQKTQNPTSQMSNSTTEKSCRCASVAMAKSLSHSFDKIKHSKGSINYSNTMKQQLLEKRDVGHSNSKPEYLLNLENCHCNYNSPKKKRKEEGSDIQAKSAEKNPQLIAFTKEKDIILCDIEDLDTCLPACNFTKPAHYYLSFKEEVRVWESE